MRRLLSFDCAGASLGGSLDFSDGTTGILFVTGGTQTRIGSHRMFESLAASLAQQGHPCFRFDRRGVGDSEGSDVGYRGSLPDLMAATDAFRREVGHMERIVGLGLCDGATALALHGGAIGLDAVILVNPWLVEAEAGLPPPAAIKRHYRDRLLSLVGWRRLLAGSISYRKAFRGIVNILRAAPSGLGAETAAALRSSRIPAQLLLARGDATAVAAGAEWNSPPFNKVRAANPEPIMIDTDSHTFARPGDMHALLESTLVGLRRLSGGR